MMDLKNAYKLCNNFFCLFKTIFFNFNKSQNFKIVHKKDLEKDVSGDVSGYFKRFIVSLCAVIIF